MSPQTPMPSSFDDHPDYITESTLQKLKRRFREEPLVPVGMLLTCGALLGATRAMNRNDHRGANVMFRRRIYAQGFTILCLIVGSAYYSKDREKRKELEKAEKAKINALKRERWLAELEIRDAEDKAAKQRMQKLRERRSVRDEAIGAKAEAKSRIDSEATEPPDPMPDMADVKEAGKKEEQNKGGIVDAVKKLIGGQK